jgi:transposase
LLAGCWTHTRRGFYDALDHAPKEAGWILRQIGHLYDIERSYGANEPARPCAMLIVPAKADSSARESTGSYTGGTCFLPKSTMGKAISYALAQWKSLEVYLRESGIEIDTNLVENAIRPTALGKKNWLFFGDADAGERYPCETVTAQRL